VILFTKGTALDPLYLGQTLLVEQPCSASCPLCGAIVVIRGQLHCSNCDFRMESEARLQKLAVLGCELLSQFCKIRIPLNCIMVRKADVPQLARVVELGEEGALIQLNAGLVGYLDQLDLGRKRLSFWICVVMHEILHYIKMGSTKSSFAKNINIYREELETRMILADVTRKMPALYEEYRSVLDSIGFPNIERECDLKLCEARGCDKRAVERCGHCYKWLCEDHRILRSHNPCKKNSLCPNSGLNYFSSVLSRA